MVKVVQAGVVLGKEGVGLLPRKVHRLSGPDDLPGKVPGTIVRWSSTGQNKFCTPLML